MTPIVAASPTAIVRHVGTVKGGQFKDGADLFVPAGTPVYSPFAAKVNHSRPDKTKCGNPGPDSVQLTLSEETMVKGNRHLTGFRLAVAHFVPIPGLGVGALHHVTEGTLVGYTSGDSLHGAANHPDRLEELTG